jgi:hypothetical protein
MGGSGISESYTWTTLQLAVPRQVLLIFEEEPTPARYGPGLARISKGMQKTAGYAFFRR